MNTDINIGDNVLYYANGDMSNPVTVNVTGFFTAMNRAKAFDGKRNDNNIEVWGYVRDIAKKY